MACSWSSTACCPCLLLKHTLQQRVTRLQHKRRSGAHPYIWLLKVPRYSCSHRTLFS